MRDTVVLEQFKGGSLSSTCLCDGDREPFVRKTASLTKNREFGFQRLYSQIKRLQRYNVMFEGMFPRVLTYGVSDYDLYVDLEYVPDSVTLHEFLCHETNHEVIRKTFVNLLAMMERLHSYARTDSGWRPIELYIQEEMITRIDQCLDSDRFRDFMEYEYLFFNGHKVKNLVRNLSSFVRMMVRLYNEQTPRECFSHGNLTLENILIQPATGRIVFIDPYEENCVDATIADHSQILQSCHSHYELYNAEIPRVLDNQVDCMILIPEGLNHFSTLFHDFLDYQYEDLRLVRLFEISQYIRMGPFKKELDEDKMVLFFSLASYLFSGLNHDH